jgi:hypothetical protein
MLFAGSNAETDATLRAMKDVATAGGTRPLSDPDRVALSAAHSVLFGGEGLLDPDGESLDEWLNVCREPPDPELHSRFDALRTAPVGTFGRTFADFCAANGFVFPGVPVPPLDPGDAADGEYPDWYHPSA